MKDLLLSVLAWVGLLLLAFAGIVGVFVLMLGVLIVGLWPVWVGVAALKYLLT